MKILFVLSLLFHCITSSALSQDTEKCKCDSWRKWDASAPQPADNDRAARKEKYKEYKKACKQGCRSVRMERKMAKQESRRAAKEAKLKQKQADRQAKELARSGRPGANEIPKKEQRENRRKEKALKRQPATN